jgi:hypothetical protein
METNDWSGRDVLRVLLAARRIAEFQQEAWLEEPSMFNRWEDLLEQLNQNPDSPVLREQLLAHAEAVLAFKR